MEKSNLIQLLSTGAVFASAIFIPVLAKELGVGPFGIGVLVAIFNLTYFLANYLFGILSDRYCIKRLVQIGLCFSTIFFFAQVLATNAQALFWIRAAAGFTAGMFPAALSIYAFEERAGKMGKFTAFNSLGWAIGSLMAGILSSYTFIFGMSALFLLVAFFVSLTLPDICSQGRSNFLPGRLVKKNLRIYFPYFMRAVGAQATWAIFPLYLISTGADKFWVGIAYFVNTGSQFVMMQSIEHLGNYYLINLGLLCTVVTFALYALLQNFWLVLGVQILLAFSFSTLQVGANQELLKTNREKGASIGILNSIVNITAVIGPFIAGVLLEYAGFPGVMWFAALVSFIGLISFTKVLK